ncbi:MAG: hypothetical protein DMF56_07205 [Acidobacteria bacterium]|nr:MAG: hypothetical protein DMF56_07205 [Acidobacteriota bacterium]
MSWSSRTAQECRRQNAEGRIEKHLPAGGLLTSAFCLLPSAFCLLPLAFCIPVPCAQINHKNAKRNEPTNARAPVTTCDILPLE